MSDTTGPKLRVFLLDDHELVRRGVRELLEGEGDIEVVGEASTAAEALAGSPPSKASASWSPRCRITATASSLSGSEAWSR